MDRPAEAASAGRGRWAAAPAASARAGLPARCPALAGRNFGPPKKKSASSEKRWENKERGPKGPIKERYTGRMGGLYDDPNDVVEPMPDFDDPASRAAEEDKDEE